MSRVGPTPGITDTDQQPIDRDDYAAFLEARLDSKEHGLSGPGPQLDRREGSVVAALLDVLHAAYPGEDLGRLARVMAVRLYDRMGI